VTPRVLDIEAAQTAMRQQGLRAKALIEGPPRRRCPILLRQTSFIAMEERVACAGSASSSGTHSARFGEIGSRPFAARAAFLPVAGMRSAPLPPRI